MWIPAIVTAGKPATEPAGKSGSPGRQSQPVTDGLALAGAPCAMRPLLYVTPTTFCQ